MSEHGFWRSATHPLRQAHTCMLVGPLGGVGAGKVLPRRLRAHHGMSWYAMCAATGVCLPTCTPLRLWCQPADCCACVRAGCRAEHRGHVVPL